MLAVLLDPDRCNIDKLPLQALNRVDLVLVGSSVLTEIRVQDFCDKLKSVLQVPIVLFPGNSNQVCDSADGILFTSLISGRNAEFLISQQVVGAPLIKKAGLEVIGTGYMLIESGRPTAAHYLTQSTPIPRNKPEIASATALAGEMFGFSATYLEAGSGAERCVPSSMVTAVRKTVGNILFVGGGIRSCQDAEVLWNAGADVVVIGSIIEDSPTELDSFLISKAVSPSGI